MSRILTCGWETADLNEAGSGVVGTNTTHSVVNTVPAPRAAGYCVKVAGTSANPGASYRTLPMAAAKTEVWVRFAFLLHGMASNNQPIFAMLNDSTGAAQACLYWDASDGLIRACRGGTTSTVLATSSTAFAQDQWHVIEWREQILTATTGTLEVWLDGNRVINFSGDVAQTTTINVQTLQLGYCASLSGAQAGNYVAFDDLAVNDTAGTLNNGRAGDGRVILLAPTGAGSSTQLVRGGTDTGANFSQVNETPPSLAQFVGSSTIGDRDLYALADIGVAVQSINCVEALVLAQNSDAGGGQIAPTIRSGSTTNEATAIGLSTSPTYVTSRWETDPNTSAAWTVAAVNALEAGVTIR